MRTIVQQWITLILIGIVWQNTASAQTFELGVGLGVSAYDGDFLSSKLEVVKTMSFAGQLQLTHHFDQRWRGQDRKSTRLNSSHVAISYAVFCLRKKMMYD